MSVRRKIGVGILAAVLGLLAYAGYRMVATVRSIPEAYAAWDTGTLLVEYMKVREGRWPTNWEDLLSVMRTNQILFRGATINDSNYAKALREKVVIDWSFDPRNPSKGRAVIRADGGEFPVVWQGKDPNVMVLKFIEEQAGTNAPGRP